MSTNGLGIGPGQLLDLAMYGSKTLSRRAFNRKAVSNETFCITLSNERYTLLLANLLTD
jgi:hypothetical protein